MLRTFGCFACFGPLLFGVEYPLRATPVDVDTQQVTESRSVTFVNWGDLSTSVRRRPERVQEEYDGLKQWLLSPEMIAELQAFGEGVSQAVDPWFQQRMAGFIQQYNSKPRVTQIPTHNGDRIHSFPLPEGMWHMDAIQRELWRVVAIDGRDPRQLAYLQSVTRSDPVSKKRTIGMVMAWNSAAERDTFGRNHPDISAIPQPDDNYIRYFDSTSLPTIGWVSADKSKIIIQAGLPLDWVTWRQGMELPEYWLPEEP